MKVVCYNCGKKISIKDEKCSKCGAQLSKSGGKVPFMHFGSDNVEIETVETQELSGGRIKIGDKIMEPMRLPTDEHGNVKRAPANFMEMMQWEIKAKALASQGLHQEALELFEKSLRVDPNAPKTLADKAAMLNQLERFGEALEASDKSLEYGSHIPIVWFIRGITLDNLGKKDEAIECFQNTLRINPQFEPAKSALDSLKLK